MIRSHSWARWVCSGRGLLSFLFRGSSAESEYPVVGVARPASVRSRREFLIDLRSPPRFPPRAPRPVVAPHPEGLVVSTLVERACSKAAPGARGSTWGTTTGPTLTTWESGCKRAGPRDRRRGRPWGATAREAASLGVTCDPREGVRRWASRRRNARAHGALHPEPGAGMTKKLAREAILPGSRTRPSSAARRDRRRCAEAVVPYSMSELVERRHARADHPDPRGVEERDAGDDGLHHLAVELRPAVGRSSADERHAGVDVGVDARCTLPLRRVDATSAALAA